MPRLPLDPEHPLNAHVGIERAGVHARGKGVSQRHREYWYTGTVSTSSSCRAAGSPGPKRYLPRTKPSNEGPLSPVNLRGTRCIGCPAEKQDRDASPSVPIIGRDPRIVAHHQTFKLLPLPHTVAASFAAFCCTGARDCSILPVHRPVVASWPA